MDQKVVITIFLCGVVIILYGCGDFLNDYEGMAGEERYCPDLTLM